MLKTARKPILQGEYKLIKVLDRRDDSAVFLACSIHNRENTYAIQQIPLDEETRSDREGILRYFGAFAARYIDLEHPGLAALRDFFYEEGYEYLVWEYVPGLRLSQVIRLRNRPFTEVQAVDMALQIGEVLDFLHHLRDPLYFGDLHPSNAIVTPRGRLKLIGCGLSKLLVRRSKEEPVLGTAGYAPWEQFGRTAVIGRTSDIYALGVLMHQLATGRDPTTAPGVLPRIRELNPSVSEDFQAIVDYATPIDPNDRYPDIRLMLRDLRAISPTRRIRSDLRSTFLHRLRRALLRPFRAA